MTFKSRKMKVNKTEAFNLPLSQYIFFKLKHLRLIVMGVFDGY